MTEILIRRRSRSLITLPDEILMQVFFFLEPEDVLSLSLVSRKFHEVSNCLIVWHNIFLNLLHRARYIDLLAIDQKSLSNVKMAELKRSLVLAASAETNWLRESPKARVPSQTINLKEAIGTNILLDQDAYITKFTSKHLLIALEGGSIVGWDLKDNISAGSYEMEADCTMVDLALEKSSCTLVGLMARVSPVRFGMHVRLGVLRIDVPEPESSGPLLFERSKQLTLLLPFSSEVHLLDVSRRMMCAAFSFKQSIQMGILVVFDWDIEDVAIINTGIPYDYGRSLIGIHLSTDGDFIVLVSESGGSEVRRWYRLADLKPSPSIWNTLEYEPRAPLDPTKQEVFRWTKEPSVLSKTEGTNVHVFWTIDQLPEPPYPEVPPRVSTIVLYITVPEAEPSPSPLDKTWRVAQYYSDKNGPRAPSRSVLTLRNSALCPNDTFDEHGMPIVCMSFNHFGWVEEVEVEGVGRRQMKLVTFPDPGTTYDGDLAETARTLDIPSDVLDDAYHVLLDATQGLIIVATEKQTLHVYRY